MNVIPILGTIIQNGTEDGGGVGGEWRHLSPVVRHVRVGGTEGRSSASIPALCW